MTKMLRLDDLQIFVNAARAGSFSVAARELDITPTFASGAIQRLEGALGVRLFVRSTRHMRLSAHGERYLPHAQAMLAAMQAGSAALEVGREEIGGEMRLSAPSDLGRSLLLGWLDEFQLQHPKLALNINLSDQAADFFQAPLDVAIRYGTLTDSSLVALPLLPENRRAACAAPAYLEAHGRPRHPDDLRHHNCLRYVMNGQTHEHWLFQLPAGLRAVAVKGNRVSNDGELVRRWALAGLGIAYKARLDILQDVRAGRLVELFAPQTGEPAPLHLVCAHRSSLSPAVQALREFLQERLEALRAEG
jgi:DNA-binding transcriptional LysR family regulator